MVATETDKPAEKPPVDNVITIQASSSDFSPMLDLINERIKENVLRVAAHQTIGGIVTGVLLYGVGVVIYVSVGKEIRIEPRSPNRSKTVQ